MRKSLSKTNRYSILCRSVAALLCMALGIAPDAQAMSPSEGEALGAAGYPESGSAALLSAEELRAQLEALGPAGLPQNRASAERVLLPVDEESEETARRVRAAFERTKRAAQRVAPVELSADQDVDVQRLRRKAGSPLQLRVRKGVRTPAQIKGRRLHPAVRGPYTSGERAQRTSRAFLRENRRLLKLRDPDAELRQRTHWKDRLGKRHIRYEQRYAGLRVDGAELIVHLDTEGNVELLDGGFAATPEEEPAPTLGGETALELARARVAGGMRASASEPELLYYMDDEGDSHLAWVVFLTLSEIERWKVVVDAHHGNILIHYNEVQSASVPGSGTDLLGQNHNFNVWSQGGTFYMIDISRPMVTPLVDINTTDGTVGGIVVIDSQLTQATQMEIATATSANGPWLADAVSAAVNIGHSYDYFLAEHGRNSLDGNGVGIFGLVRWGSFINNGFWNGRQILLGNGAPIAASTDFVGHELTHGVINSIGAGGILDYVDESGALNESYADIFGEMIETRVTGSHDWLWNATAGGPNFVRSFSDPPSKTAFPTSLPYPKKYSDFIGRNHPDPSVAAEVNKDNGGVHFNSSINNHAFYLLAEGLPGAIGDEQAAQIFYRSMTMHLTKRSQFVDSRRGCVTAAEELFGVGSPQALKTAEAFDAVEVFDTGATPEPDPFPVPVGSDQTLFVRSFNNGNFLVRNGPADPPEGTSRTFFPVAFQRPTISGDGGTAAFINASADLCFVDTQGLTVETCSGLPNLQPPVFARSAAISRDGNSVALVLQDFQGNADNEILLLDIPGNTSQRIQLQAPVIDGLNSDDVLFAEIMDFAANGRVLVYDALNAVVTNAGSSFLAWSIYALDLLTGEIIAIVPPVTTPGVNTGNPQLSRTSDERVVFEVIQVDFLGNVTRSDMFAMNLFTGEVGFIGFVNGSIGLPGYNADDTGILLTAPDNQFTGASMFLQPIQSDRINPNGQGILWIPNAAFGAIYRPGTFEGPGTDTDGDRVPDTEDNCTTTRNPNQGDFDEDGVGDLCDNCVLVANPVLGTQGAPARASFQSTTGGQLDDDADGIGNQCDAKFNDQGQVVGGLDLSELLASFNKARNGNNCGTQANRPCAVFDLDNSGQFIGGTDLTVGYGLFNLSPGPSCGSCPLECVGPACP